MIVCITGAGGEFNLRIKSYPTLETSFVFFFQTLRMAALWRFSRARYLMAIDKMEVVKKIFKGLEATAFKRSFTQSQFDDFKQDALYAVLKVMDLYTDKSAEELVKICGRVAVNAIKDAQRKAMTLSKYYTGKEDITLYGRQEQEIDDFLVKRFIMNKLSDGARKVFSEKLDPSPKTSKIALDEFKQKEVNKANGKLVMSVNELKITDAHISKSINMSKATVSRHMSEIRRRVIETIRETE